MILQDNYKDFNQKYGDCVLRVIPKGGEPELVNVNELDMPGKNLSTFQLKSGTWVPKKYKVSDIEMDDTWPTLGMINMGGKVVYVQRTVMRQFRKSFTFKNNIVVANYIEPWIVHKTGMATGVSDARAVEHIFNPIYYPIEEALERITRKDAVSTAITPRYYISVSAYLPYVYLGFMGKVIGKVDQNNGSVELFSAAVPLIEDVSNYVDVTGVINDV